jgi:alpha-L-rhamnosidase
MLDDPGMNSFNHYAYGAVGEWLYRYMAGIDEDPDHPGFQHILLHPQFDATLGTAGATYQSPYGDITSNWEYADHTIIWDVVIPPNTTATLEIPAGPSTVILENGKPLHAHSTTSLEKNENGSSSYMLGSGTYRFTIRQK